MTKKNRPHGFSFVNNTDGEGILNKVSNATYSSNDFTYDDFKKLLEDLNNYNPPQQKLSIPAVFLLGMSDKDFIETYNDNQCEVWGGSDAFNKIEERAKKLGLKK